MSSIPVDALQFGGRSITDSKVSYDKTRLSGSTKVSYILHSKGGCMPGQEEVFTTTPRTSPGIGATVESNKVTTSEGSKMITELNKQNTLTQKIISPKSK